LIRSLLQLNCVFSPSICLQIVPLSVPSAVNPVEQNILLNPLHPDARSIGLISYEPFSFGLRLPGVG
jgi:RES domain-containing protein